LIQHLHKEVDGLQVSKLVIVRIYADAEEEACISPVNNLGAALELDEIGLILLIPWCDETVNLLTPI
jgi:hypothetical protein